MSAFVASRPSRYLRDNAGVGLRTSLSGKWSKIRTPFLIYLVLALTVALNSTEVFPASIPPLWKVLVLPPFLFIFPCLLEETFFRGVLLPQNLSSATPLRRFVAISASTAIFTIWHPLNHWLIGLTDTSVFIEPEFLLVVVALGYACGYAYLRTGSLWAPISIHWATVVPWNLFFGR